MNFLSGSGPKSEETKEIACCQNLNIKPQVFSRDLFGKRKLKTKEDANINNDNVNFGTRILYIHVRCLFYDNMPLKKRCNTKDFFPFCIVS